MRSVVVVVVLCSLLGGCCTSELHSYAPNHIIENPSQIRSECAKQVLRISGLKVHRLCMQSRTRLTHRPSDRATNPTSQPNTTHPRSSRLCVHVCVRVHNRNCVNKNVINYMCVLGGLSLIRCQDLGGQAGRSVSGGVWYRHKCNPRSAASWLSVGRTRLLRYPCDCEYYIILSVHRV